MTVLGDNMLNKPLEQGDINAIRVALRAKNRAQVELNLLMCDLEDRYDFSIEAGDQIDMAKGVVIYARPNNTVEPVDQK